MLNLGLWAFGVGLQAYTLLALAGVEQDTSVDPLVMVHAMFLALLLSGCVTTFGFVTLCMYSTWIFNNGKGLLRNFFSMVISSMVTSPNLSSALSFVALAEPSGLRVVNLSHQHIRISKFGNDGHRLDITSQSNCCRLDRCRAASYEDRPCYLPSRAEKDSKSHSLL